MPLTDNQQQRQPLQEAVRSHTEPDRPQEVSPIEENYYISDSVK